MRRYEETVQRLSINDAVEAAEVLAEAFYNDPLWVYLEPNNIRRKKIIQKFFKIFVYLQLNSSLVYGIGDPLKGVASWKPPTSRKISLWEGMKTAWRIINSGIIGLYFSRILRMLIRSWRIFTRIEKMHKKYAPEPHYYLEMIGIFPTSQGKGLASKLINYVLKHVDAKSMSTYLETLNPKNVALYEHFGFEFRERWDIPGINVSVWALYRPVKS
ncbi:MAG: GNAT family N-acetyltransferase [Candidatus Helarchaeota archaeon]|nr:GNAT family N-acetyltransferase [Candidatus Helarchaeota archaeon]